MEHIELLEDWGRRIPVTYVGMDAPFERHIAEVKERRGAFRRWNMFYHIFMLLFYWNAATALAVIALRPVFQIPATVEGAVGALSPFFFILMLACRFRRTDTEEALLNSASYTAGFIGAAELHANRKKQERRWGPLLELEKSLGKGG